jgi:predicted unusual protein kinase regulating ubiquinone biosynthesis (AarF/ABC1/UbiB family)
MPRRHGEEKCDDAMATGRLRRTAELGELVAGESVRAYATKAANVARSRDARQAADERRAIEAAGQIVDVLGHMKGAAMKVGQIASFIDPTGLPPEERERFQAKLAVLRDSAPPVDFKKMRKVIEEDLGERLDDVFAEFEPQAVAAASIGQVYRARLADGRPVAVKVQYPGVQAAVRADLQNMGLLLRAARRIAPGLDAKAVAQELRDRLTEELEYEHEAQEQREFARRFDGHPFVVVPAVMTEVSGERVLVSEWVEGLGFAAVKKLDRAATDRFAEIVFRFFFGSLYRDGHFSGDPHPGNYMLLDDGRVAFIDFGMTKRIDREGLAHEKAAIVESFAGDAARVRSELAALGFLAPADRDIDSDELLAYVRSFHEWHAEDRPFTLTGNYVTALISSAIPGSRDWDLQKRLTMPPAALVARRLETLVVGVMGQLEATANWHRIMAEWLESGAPSTPLGEQEAAFFGTTGAGSPAAVAAPARAAT